MTFQHNDNLNDLIQQAGRSAGVNPNQLKQAVDSGKLDDLLKKMRPQDAQRFQQILSNPQLAQQMLNTPQAKRLIRQFMKDQ